MAKLPRCVLGCCRSGSARWLPTSRPGGGSGGGRGGRRVPLSPLSSVALAPRGVACLPTVLPPPGRRARAAT
eukprot:8347344-Alexandrium_andersonii.AAC.1